MGKSLFRTDEATIVETPVTAPADARALMLDHYAQYLRVATNRNNRPYDEATIKSYLRCARALAAWLDEQDIPGDLTPACSSKVLNDFFRDYMVGHTLNGTALMHRTLRALFNWIEQEHGLSSPYRSRELASYKPQIHKPKVLAKQFLDELFASFDNTFTGIRDEALVRLLLEGLRVGEVLDITPDQVPTLDVAVIRVAPKKGERKYAEGSGRRIGLAESTVRALQRYVRVRERHPLANTALRHALWLGHRTAVPLTYDGVRQMLERRSKRLGYDKAVTAHMFRHTYSNDYLEAGGSPNDLVVHMGWSDWSRLKIYGVDMAESRAITSKAKIGELY